MRGLKISTQSKRPDTPLAPTPISVMKGKILTEKKPVNVMKGKILKPAPNGGYSTGVQVSTKDEKAHPEDFKYLKKK